MKTIHNRKMIGIATAILGSVVLAVACVKPYSPSCFDLTSPADDGSEGQCTNGQTNEGGCTTFDTVASSQDSGSDPGNYQTDSSATCTWDCFHMDNHGVMVGCGEHSIPWSGFKPNSQSCPNGG